MLKTVFFIPLASVVASVVLNKRGMYVRYRHYRCCSCQPNKTIGRIVSLNFGIGRNLKITHTMNQEDTYYYHNYQCLDFVGYRVCYRHLSEPNIISELLI